MSEYLYNLGLLFKDVVGRNRHNTALNYTDGKKVSFEELDQWSDLFAQKLIDKGVNSNDVVAIINNKNELCFAMMLACLKLGLIYTNIDPNSPKERLDRMLNKANPKLIFIDPDLEEGEIVNHNFHSEVELLRKPLGKLERRINYHAVTGSFGAYIMFTSGSTGFPKGALMSHSNIINLIQWAKTTFNITENDISTNVNPIYFDNSVFDFYSSVFNGACMVPVKNDELKDGKELVGKIENMGCTIWFSVPSMLIYLLTVKAIDEGKLKNVKKFIFGGEGFPKTKLKLLFDFVNQTADLINVYGPTECTCICSAYFISIKDFTNLKELTPLGNLAPNFDYEIIPLGDSEKNKGELCLKGPNVGLGYYNDEERTSLSFIQNPYNKYYKEIVYRTGDLVKIDSYGEFHFLGRIDNQIKHMGFRIELEEIESGLNTINGVKEAAVIYQKVDEIYGNIIAFVGGQVENKFILQEIKKILPEYMVPRKVYVKQYLPKNSNGKIDRTALKSEIE